MTDPRQANNAALTAAIIRELRLGVSHNRLRIIAATLGLPRDTGISTDRPAQ